MTLTYSIPAQTITFEWTPQEQAEVAADVRAAILKDFTDLIALFKNAEQSKGKARELWPTDTMQNCATNGTAFLIED